MTTKIIEQERNPLNIFFASALSSIFSTIFTNPIEIMKLNQQYIPLTCPQYPKKCNPSIIECICNPIHIRQNVFNGLSVVIPQVLFSNIIFMQLYQYQKRVYLKNDIMQYYTSISTIISAVSSRLIVSLITSPIQAKRVRMSNNTNSGLKINHLNFEQNKSSIRATLTRDLIFSSIYWSLIEILRNRISGSQYRKKQKNNYQIIVDNMISGCVAGCLASLITNPLDIVKTRIQSKSSIYTSMRSQLINIYKKEGIEGFFLGAKYRILKCTSHSILYLMIFEIFIHNVHTNQ